jgi:hypothetical protein
VVVVQPAAVAAATQIPHQHARNGHNARI